MQKDTNSPVIFYDGVCNLCSGAVQFMIKHDRYKKFKFASLQSKAGELMLLSQSLDPVRFDSFVLTSGEKVYLKSDAALKVAGMLPFPWKLLGIFRLIPRPLRDSLYGFIARNRYKWFGKKEQCMLPDPSVKERFLD
ncbi:DUF393 domain-containing protein [Bacillus mangrovi]|uniref:DUF393 domain-containing protein n=1 Tax=Metabacillus mangrovi TaxID=1491830 RepID=A0A7X2V659_9BACI|nr:thiol-disulfide oxidoreductase DCC family protein [Metabacillus mangrovi]MTH55527.1 DUF393 domain-containing protein [Metabacillus mangrovi]